jgi:ABC-type uncharacterized transport system substrate-binding protein
MNRREGLAILAALCADAPLDAYSQTFQTARRIAYLGSVTMETDRDRLAEFRRELRGFGYVEGRNLNIDSRYEVEVARLAPLANELAGLKPDVFVTIATPATVAAKNATRQIPIVFAAVGDPVALGLVASLSRPGGNVTGVANIVADLAGKRLEMLKELLPGLAFVGVLLEPQNPVSVLQWEASERAARGLALRLHPMRIESPNAYEAAFGEASAVGVKAVAASLSPVASAHSARIARLAAQYRLPSIYARTQFVEDGGLMSYGAGYAADGRGMARLVQRIFAGARPAELPVEQPTEFELVINMKAARQLGLTIPQSLSLRADRLID